MKKEVRGYCTTESENQQMEQKNYVQRRKEIEQKIKELKSELKMLVHAPTLIDWEKADQVSSYSEMYGSDFDMVTRLAKCVVPGLTVKKDKACIRKSVKDLNEDEYDRCKACADEILTVLEKHAKKNWTDYGREKQQKERRHTYLINSTEIKEEIK